MNKKRIIFGYLFGFVFSALIVLIVLLLVYKFTVGNKNYILKTLKQDNYYERLDEEIKEEMNMQILSSGFTSEIIQDVYSYDKLVEDINHFIDNVYIGKLTTLDNSDIRYNINTNIDNFFKKSKLVTVNKDDLKSFVNDLVNIYNDEVRLYGFTDSLIPHIPKINKLVNIALIITTVFLVIVLVILIKIKYQYFSSSIIASGLIILFIRLFIFEKIDVNELLIITEKFSEELRVVLNNLQNMLLIIAILLIILELVFIFVKLLCQPKKIKT